MFTNPITEPSDEIKEAACRLFLIMFINNNDECNKHLKEILEADGSVLDKELLLNTVISSWHERITTLLAAMK